MAVKLVSVKRYACSKYIVYADGPEEYEEVIARALKNSVELKVAFHESAFDRLLREGGVPGREITATIDSWRFVDETYSGDRWPL